MRILKIPVTVLAALATSALPVLAQWPSYPTPGPRTKDGKIDLAAPPPGPPMASPTSPGYGNLRAVREAAAVAVRR